MAWHAGERDMQVYAYGLLTNRGNFARQPAMGDFQMVGQCYDDKDTWQTLLIPKTSEGKKAVSGGTKMTYRYYLQDMAFAVALQGPYEELAELEAALRSPVWDLYLGRKNCAPTEFIAQGIHADAEQAMDLGRQHAKAKNRRLIFKVLQGEFEGEVLTLNDVPCSLEISCTVTAVSPSCQRPEHGRQSASVR